MHLNPIILLLFLSLFVHASFGVDCIHDLISKDFVEQRGEQKYASGHTRSSFQNIRILLDVSNVATSDSRTCTSAGQMVQIGTAPSDSTTCTTANSYQNCWYTCASADILTSAKLDYIVNSLLPAGQQFWQSTISVNPVVGQLQIADGECGSLGGVNVPASYQDTGVSNTDLILFATARPTAPSVIAWAIECRADQYGRPVAGQINIGPASIDPGELALNSKVIIHEMTHVLGFTFGKFPSYLDSNGNPYSEVYVEENGANGGSIYRVVTPNVQAAVRTQFNCSTLDGAELEDGGGSGSAYSHWEKRTYRNEYMTATYDVDGSIISLITFALLSDMGWYVVNNDNAEVLIWGLNQGCQFATGKCPQWLGRAYACLTPNADSCSFDRNHKAVCFIGTYSSALPSKYQWFQNPDLGGWDSFADYCPEYIPYSNGACNNASNMGADWDVYYGASYGNSNSKCLESTLLANDYSPPITDEYIECYDVTCNSGGYVQISIGGRVFPCSPEGGHMSISGFQGYINCPAYSDFCFGSSGSTSSSSTSSDTNTGSPSSMSSSTLTGRKLFNNSNKLIANFILIVLMMLMVVVFM